MLLPFWKPVLRAGCAFPAFTLMFKVRRSPKFQNPSKCLQNHWSGAYLITHIENQDPVVLEFNEHLARKQSIPLFLRAPYGQLPPGLCKPSGFKSHQQVSLEGWTRARAGSMAASQGRKDLRVFLKRAGSIGSMRRALRTCVRNTHNWEIQCIGSLSDLLGSADRGRRLRDIAGPRRQIWGLVWGTKPSPVSRAPSGRSPCFYLFGNASCASTA